MQRVDLWYSVVNRINVKAIAMLIAAFFAVTGVILIEKGIYTYGVIDLKLAFGEGRFTSGPVGIVILFLSAIVSTGCLFSPRHIHQIEMRYKDCTLKWRGTSYMLRQDVFSPMLASLEKMGGTKANITSSS